MGSRTRSATPRPAWSHCSEPPPALGLINHIPTLPKQGPEVHDPLRPSKESPTSPFPRCTPDTLGWLLGAICLVSLGLCEESNFGEATGTAWRGLGKVSPCGSHGGGKALFRAGPKVTSGISLGTNRP